MKAKEKQAVCLTHIGRRPNHEDNFLFSSQYLSPNIQQKMNEKGLIYLVSNPDYNDLQIYAISDGMGGQNGGEVASNLCVKRLQELEKELRKVSKLKEFPKIIQKAIGDINQEMCRLSLEYPELDDMGATLILLIRIKDYFMFFNIGDSRAYFYDDNHLVQLTTDHTEGQRMLDMGILEPEELNSFPARKSLNRYLGYNRSGAKLKADEIFYKIRHGYIVLCSDGVTDNLSEKQLEEILRSGTDLVEVGKNLIGQAVSFKKADNATAIIIPV